jgi:parallel beta-helix repeat protein
MIKLWHMNNRYRIFRELAPAWCLRYEVNRWPLIGRMRLAKNASNSPVCSLNNPVAAPNEDMPRLNIEPGWHARRINRELAVLSERGGGIAHFPAGSFYHDASIFIPSRIYLVGADAGTELWFNGADFGFVLGHENLEKSAEYIKISNICIRHKGPFKKFAAAIYARHACHIVIDKITLPAPERLGVFLADHVQHATIQHVHVINAGLDGFGLLRGVENIHLENCAATHGQQSGMLLADWPVCQDAAPDDYNEQARQAGIGFQPNDPHPRHITIHKCVFAHNRKMGICTDGAGHLNIENCQLIGNQCEGITLDNGTWGANVADCTIRENGRRGHQNESELHEDQVHHDGLLSDGTSPVKLPGISMDNAAFCRIENCRIEDNYGDGVKFVRAGYRTMVKFCRIWSNNRGGSRGHPHFGVRIGSDLQGWPDQVDFPSHEIQILHNDILGGHTCGIILNHGVLNSQICYNSIRFQYEEAIRNLSRRFNKIADNLIEPE